MKKLAIEKALKMAIEEYAIRGYLKRRGRYPMHFARSVSGAFDGYFETSKFDTKGINYVRKLKISALSAPIVVFAYRKNVGGTFVFVIGRDYRPCHRQFCFQPLKNLKILE